MVALSKMRTSSVSLTYSMSFVALMSLLSLVTLQVEIWLSWHENKGVSNFINILVYYLGGYLF